MPIVVQCSACGGKFRASDEAAGRTVKCPKCSAAIAVGVPQQQRPVQPAVVERTPSQPPPHAPARTDAIHEQTQKSRRPLLWAWGGGGAATSLLVVGLLWSFNTSKLPKDGSPTAITDGVVSATRTAQADKTVEQRGAGTPSDSSTVPTRPYYSVEKTAEGNEAVIHHLDGTIVRLTIKPGGFGGEAAFDKNGKNRGFVVYKNGEVQSVQYAGEKLPKRDSSQQSAADTDQASGQPSRDAKHIAGPTWARIVLDIVSDEGDKSAAIFAKLSRQCFAGVQGADYFEVRCVQVLKIEKALPEIIAKHGAADNADKVETVHREVVAGRKDELLCYHYGPLRLFTHKGENMLYMISAPVEWWEQGLRTRAKEAMNPGPMENAGNENGEERNGTGPIDEMGK